MCREEGFGETKRKKEAGERVLQRVLACSFLWSSGLPEGGVSRFRPVSLGFPSLALSGQPRRRIGQQLRPGLGNQSAN